MNDYRRCRKVLDLCKSGISALKEDSVDVEKIIKTLTDGVMSINTSVNRKDWFVNIGGDDDSAILAAQKH